MSEDDDEGNLWSHGQASDDTKYGEQGPGSRLGPPQYFQGLARAAAWSRIENLENYNLLLHLVIDNNMKYTGTVHSSQT